MTMKDNIFDLYAQAYESQKQHKMSLREYLEGCRADPATYASTAERMITAIGEPEFVDSAKDDRAHRRLLPSRRAGSRGEEADPLPAGPRRRRQVLARRPAQGPDGEMSGLCAGHQ